MGPLTLKLEINVYKNNGNQLSMLRAEYYRTEEF
jgi:hypothetical protein